MLAMSGTGPESALTNRVVVEQSVRRLCNALKAFAEASAIADARAAVRSWLPGCHAAIASSATTKTAVPLMTEVNMDPTRAATCLSDLR